MTKTTYHDYSTSCKSLGLQPGELYEQAEECFTCETKHCYGGRIIEVYFDEMAGPLSQWKAFCMGIGTVSGLERDNVIQTMKARIEQA